MGANRCLSAGLAAVSIALTVAACDDAALAVNCAGGPLLELEGHPYCVYGTEHVAATDGGFRCPRGVPTRIELGGGTVCTDRDVPPCALPAEVCTLLGRCCEPDASVPDADVPDAGAIDLGPPPDARVEPDARMDTDARVERDSGPSDAGEPATCPGTSVIDGPEHIADSYLVGATCDVDRRDSNQGAGASFQVADIPWACFWLTHGIMRVDIAGALPEDARVVSASLNLFVERECSVSVGDPDNCGSLAETWEVAFRPLRREWLEDEVTWLDARLGSRWENQGADDLAEDIFAAPAHAATIAPGDVGVVVNVDVTDSVRGYLDGTLENHGWLMTAPRLGRPHTRNVVFTSSESTMTEQRPRLYVDYEAPCP